MQEEQDSGVDTPNGCFTEGSDSILSVFCCEPLRKKLKGTNEFLG